MEKQISFTTSKSYSTLNTFSSKTKNVWFVFHGMGYLSKYFIQYFKDIDPEENYIIAPQAPSKYYQDKKFKYVGASWLTKENTEIEKENVLAYIDSVWQNECIKWQDQHIRIILMGYSQGVSIVTRWAARSKVQCNYLLLHSGAIPKELNKEDFSFLPEDTPVTYLYGNQDKYINETRITEQKLKGTELFGDRLNIEVFEGIHEVNTNFLKSLL